MENFLFFSPLIQPNDDKTILTAKLFPVFHIAESVGLQEILWLMGEVEDDENKSILRR